MAQKEKNKVLKIPIILIIAIIIGVISFLNSNQFEIIRRGIIQKQLQAMTQEELESVGHDGIITDLTITQTKTGTGPFDDDNEPGNDKDEDNNIVRSFDQITWTVESTMKLKPGVTVENHTGGAIEVKAELPATCANKVIWDLDSMKWAENPVVSADGRTFTAIYTLTDQEVTVPGKQTLVFVLKVLGAANGLEITPTFTECLIGNTEEEKKQVIANSITVSAAPNYNIEIVRNGSLANKATVDYGEGDKAGRMYGYALLMQLYNTDENKGLKGIEYPDGDINFDINLKLTRTLLGSTEQEDITNDCTPILWNYKINQFTNDGIIPGRNMRFKNDFSQFLRNMPYGIRTSDRTKSTYQSGNITMTQTGRKIKTKISDYGFDGIFPNYAIYTTSTTPPLWGNNIGCFNITYFQVFVPDNEASTMGDRNYYLTVSDDNLDIKSISGAIPNEQQDKGDDSEIVQHVIYKPGYYEQALYIEKDGGAGYLGKSHETGDAKATLGQYFELWDKFTIGFTNDENVESATKFIRFDGDGFEPVLFPDNTKYKKQTFNGDMTFNVWYVTKQDGTNWQSQTEMNNAKIQDMLYYENIEDIPEGHICVGEYLESITGNITPETGDMNVIRIRLKVKNSAKIGKTYGITDTTTDWVEYVDRSQYTITKNNFSEWPQCTWTSGNRNYIKTEYNENGSIQSGTHNGGWLWGQSLLVIGSNLSLSKTAIDPETNNAKVNYDMGKNEFDVTYKLTPVLPENSSSNVTISNVTLKIEDTLPKGITYIPGSSNLGEPEITNNADETRTLKWNIYNCTVGEAINPIIYKAHLNEESPNGTQYLSTAIVSEVIGNDGISKIGNSEVGNRTAKNTIQIINLSSYSLFKTTETPIIEVNGDVHYKITVLNKTDDSVPAFQLLDILPYNGDGRGTNYQGSYTVKKIELNQVNSTTNEVLNNSNLTIKTTEDESARTGVTSKDVDLGQGWTTVESGDTINRELKAFAVIGELPARAKLEVEILLKTSGNRAYDKYNNSATAQTNTETEEIVTPIIMVQDIKRTLEGKIWLDSNGDGLITEGEDYLSGANVTLLNEDGTRAEDIEGNEIESQTTSTNGYYKFEDMKKGKYKVKIEYDTEDGIREITTKNVGTNIEINSKFNSNGTTDLITGLNNIASPEIKIEHQNAGITYKDTSVVVHHYIEGTTEKVPLKAGGKATDQTIEGKVKDSYTTQAVQVPDYYELVSVPTNANGTMTKDEITVTYYYRLKKYPYIVKYIDKDTGTEIRTQKNGEEKNYGTEITVESEKVEIDKYTFDSAKIGSTNMVDGTKLEIGTNAEENVINLYYIKKKGTVTTKYIDKNTGREIPSPTGESLREQTTEKVDEEYTTIKKEIEGYTYVEDTGNTEGLYTVEPIEVTYYYKKNTKVTVNYIDKITNEPIKETDGGDSTVIQQGLEGDRYTATSKNFENYVLAERPEEETVTMTADEIVLNYYYIHVSGGVIEKHIDDITGEILENEVHEGKEGDDYDIPSKEFEGYELVEEKNPTNSKGKMTIEPIEVIYYYRYPTKVTVKYIDQIKEEKLAEGEEIEGYKGEDYTTEKKNFEGYEFVEDTENTEGKMTKEPIEVVYYYKKKTKVTVNYIDKTTGEKLDSTEQEGLEGDEYTATQKEFKYYDLVEKPEKETIKMKDEEVVLNYYYEKYPTKVIVKFIDKDTNKEIENQEVIEGYNGEEYTTEAKEFREYDLVETPENASGEMTKEEIEVVYYYKHKTGKVIIEHIDQTTEKVMDKEEISGNMDDEYKTKPKDYNEYDLTKMPENAEGTMTDGEITVKYYYIKKSKVETIYVDEETEKEISEKEVIDGHVGTEYVTNKKDIQYYTYEKSTNNTKGKMSDEKIIVKYYYKKKEFNLKADKWVDKVSIDGKNKKGQTYNGREKLYKTEIHKTKISTANVKITYKIRITNTGKIPGSVEEIKETIPKGLEFKNEDNDIKWSKDGDKLITKELKDITIEPGKYKEIEITFRWKKGTNNLGSIVNKVTIEKINNDAGFKETSKEDNGAESNMIITVSTGNVWFLQNTNIIVISVIILTISSIGIICYKRKK